MSGAKRGAEWAQPAAALLAVLLVVVACAEPSTKPDPAPPPPASDAAPGEVSSNLALALGQVPGAPPEVAEMRGDLPRALVGDPANAAYSGERLIGGTNAPTLPAASARPPATAAPVPPAAPPAPAPRVAVATAPPVPLPSQPAATQTAVRAPPAPPPAPPPASQPNARGITAQLGAFRSRARAESGWQHWRKANPDLLGERALILHEADLGEDGIYYRVRTGPFPDTEAAAAFCRLLRAREQDCLVMGAQ